MRSYYSKLVRDKIPEIIKAAGLDYEIQILSEIAYQKALRKKLVEEAQEVAKSGSEKLLEELADLSEVIEALLVAYNISQADLDAQKKKRKKDRGGFAKRIQLNWTSKKSEQEAHFSLPTNIEEYLKKEVAPQSQILDQNWQELQKSLLGLGRENLLALRVAKNLGGLEWDDLTFYRWQMLISRYSGALAFLQAQHQSAASQIAASDNLQLKLSYLPSLGNGQTLIGVAFSHLRRLGTPELLAHPVPGGYILAGTVPWITGYHIFSEFIVGASLAEGGAIYGLVPFTPVVGQISFRRHTLLAAPATNTVEAQINQWFLPQEKLVAFKTASSLQVTDQKNVLGHGYMALGCAQGGLELLHSIAEQKSLYFIEKTRERLDNEWRELEYFMFSSQEICYQERLRYRVKAINLAGRVAWSVVIATGGSANILEHPAARIYREALLFTLSGQTLDVMQGSLDELTD